jgi:hypothetical protein
VGGQRKAREKGTKSAMRFRFKFETLDNPKRGVVIEGTSFSLALKQAAEKLLRPIQDVILTRQERQEEEEWVVIFDPFKGVY